MSDKRRPKAPYVGLTELVRDGWFNGKTGELVKGVRVRAIDTVIDVGCGEGGLTGFCAGEGAEILFIDKDAEKLARAEEKVRKSPARAYRAIQSDCDPIPLDDDTGDLVICTDVLDHVAVPAEFLRELVRVARPGARLVLTVPDARSEQLVAATAPQEYFQAPFHIHTFTADDFCKLVLDAGLKIESRQSMGCFWSIYLTLSWLTADSSMDMPVDNPHPITDHWTRLWLEVQRHPEGDNLRAALNQLLPRTQAIVARKPL